MTAVKRPPGTFAGLRRIITTLRGPEGCPWDRVQTHESLAPYLLEEAHESLDAITRAEPEKLCEELGDLLFEVLIQVQLAEEEGAFTMRDVVFGISEKLVRRHPHVFGEAIAETPEAVIEQWDELKASERGSASAVEGIPRALPALAQAQALQRRAARAGFRFESADGAWQALAEELDELRAAATPEERREELGDSLFALANLGRDMDIDAEDALRSTSAGFTRIFQLMEEMARDRNIDLREAAIEQKLALWEEAKGKRKTRPAGDHRL